MCKHTWIQIQLQKYTHTHELFSKSILFFLLLFWHMIWSNAQQPQFIIFWCYLTLACASALFMLVQSAICVCLCVYIKFLMNNVLLLLCGAFFFSLSIFCVDFSFVVYFHCYFFSHSLLQSIHTYIQYVDCLIVM